MTFPNKILPRCVWNRNTMVQKGQEIMFIKISDNKIMSLLIILLSKVNEKHILTIKILYNMRDNAITNID